jgi:hypothetical protein
MLDHVSDLPRAARFHDPVMAALRLPCVHRDDNAIGDGQHRSVTDDARTR